MKNTNRKAREIREKEMKQNIKFIAGILLILSALGFFIFALVTGLKIFDLALTKLLLTIVGFAILGLGTSLAFSSRGVRQ